MLIFENGSHETVYSVRKSDRDGLSEYVGISNVFLSQQDLRKVHMNAEEYVS